MYIGIYVCYCQCYILEYLFLFVPLMRILFWISSDVYAFLKLNIQYLPIFRYDYKWISAKWKVGLLNWCGADFCEYIAWYVYMYCMYSWECMYVMRNGSAYLCIHHRFDRRVDEKWLEKRIWYFWMEDNDQKLLQRIDDNDVKLLQRMDEKW